MEEKNISLTAHYPGEAAGQYQIYIRNQIISSIGSILGENGVHGQLAIITNSLIWSLYSNQIGNSLQNEGYTYLVCLLPDGETYKNFDTVNFTYRQLRQGGLNKDGIILALGGGVISDLAGFVAGTYLRGLQLILIPTSLIAMVDACVGAKSAINLPEGKNLVGTFTQPILVLIDPKTLTSLPECELRSGIAEVIKHGLIGDGDLFEELEKWNGDIDDWTDCIVRSLRVKIHFVEKDLKGKGLRGLLKLGHTVGYALEKLSDFKMRHGEAVSIGITAATHIAVETHRVNPQILDRVSNVLYRYNLPVTCPDYSATKIWNTMTEDLAPQHSLRWVLPKEIGAAEIYENIPKDVIFAVLRQMGAGK